MLHFAADAIGSWASPALRDAAVGRTIIWGSLIPAFVPRGAARLWLWKKIGIHPVEFATMVVSVIYRLMPVAKMRFNWLALFVKGQTNVLERDGHVNQAMMRRHYVRPEDLAEALRMQGIDDVRMAKLVTFERGGKITAIPKASR